VIVAAIITPPDAITMMMVGIPLYFLYEVSMIVVKRVDKEKKRKEEKEEAEALAALKARVEKEIEEENKDDKS
jgi:sec-independent protein translocase protein TatC